jgi:hypothetical protein
MSTWLSLCRRLSMVRWRARIGAADQLGGSALPQLLLELTVAAHQSPALEGLPHGGPDAVDVVEGLGEIVERAAADATDRALDARVAGHHDDLDLGALALQPLEQVEAVRAAQEEIQQHDRQVRVGQQRLCLLPRFRQGRVVPVRLEDAPQRTQQQRLIVHQQDEVGRFRERIRKVPSLGGRAGRRHALRIGPGFATLEWAGGGPYTEHPPFSFKKGGLRPAQVHRARRR